MTITPHDIADQFRKARQVERMGLEPWIAQLHRDLALELMDSAAPTADPKPSTWYTPKGWN